MKSATILCDPIADGASVQISVVKLVARSLTDFDSIRVISPFISEKRINEISKTTGENVLSLSKRKVLLQLLYHRLRNNESMLWALSWLLESMFRANSSAIVGEKKTIEESTVINISYTLPYRSKLFWNQATPVLVTLSEMVKSNILAKLILKFCGPFIRILDEKLLSSHLSKSEFFANNSHYLKDLYSRRNHPSEIVLYTPKILEKRKRLQSKRSRSYVLAYIGKETEIDTLLEMRSNNIQIISFGSKIPYGTNIGRIREMLNFRGYVDEDDLALLYYNALFTAFPFTEEPFGWVPLESMYYGTPVLSYNKQGPAETILDHRTGWLVNTKEEFLKQAIEIWNKHDTGISEKECELRSKEFSLEKTSARLDKILSEDIK